MLMKQVIIGCGAPSTWSRRREVETQPNLPTEIVPNKSAWRKLSGKFPVGLGVPPLKTKALLESNPLKSLINPES